MNILVTTVTVSTKKVEQLLLLVNNISSPFSIFPDEFYEFRKINNLSSVDECWIITSNKHALQELKKYCKISGCKIKIFFSSLISGLDTEKELRESKALIYNVVLKAKKCADKLYLSSDDGTIYGDMQETARIFGCDCFLYIKNDTNVPLMIQENIPSSLFISTDNEISYMNYPLESELDTKESERKFEIYYSTPNYHLLDELETRNKQAIHLYGNFYGMVKNPRKEREIFRKLYYLPQHILDKLKDYKLGECKEKDLWIIQHLPKADKLRYLVNTKILQV